MKLKITTYASLKEILDQSFEIEIEDGSTIDDLREKIVMIKPEAKALITICRFAVNESIVNDTTLIKEDEHVHIIPPASGG